MKNANDLLDDMPVWNAFLRLAVPSVAAQLINILYNFISFVSKKCHFTQMAFFLNAFYCII